MRKIAVVTGSRAEYGLLYWLIRGIDEDPELELLLFVTGMHLSPEFGYTVSEIERDGFFVAERVEMLLSGDTDQSTAVSMGLGMIGFASAYERRRPDIIVVLGDRFEIFAAVCAAVPFAIPVAHIHGGELTEGAIDEMFRHAITKMSQFHFTSAMRYRDRVIQMGEEPERVFCYGAPGLDSIYKLELLDKAHLFNELGIPADKRFGIVTYHAETLGEETLNNLNEMLLALSQIKDIYWVFTMANADAGGRLINEKIRGFIGKSPDSGRLFTSLGQLKYLSSLKHADIMVGNSSSGLIESPSFSLPVVNIGHRQGGRVRGANVIDVTHCKGSSILDAINKGLSPEFRDSIKGMENPYGNDCVSDKILHRLKTLPIEGGVRSKRFLDNIRQRN